MTLRVCSVPGCPVLVPVQGPCNTHAREKDKARGTRQERGYDATYDAFKRTPAYLHATHCHTCHRPFTKDNPKTAGHTIALRNGGRGSRIVPQCRECNYGWRKTGT